MMRALSLGSKLVALCVTSVVLSAGSIALVAHQKTKGFATEQAIALLGADAEYNLQRVESRLEAMQQDASILATMPAVEGIFRSRDAAAGRDPRDGSSEDLWRGRLENIFHSVFEARPEYTQIRLIGLADDGMEIVRVDRTSNGLVVTARQDLQPKGSEPYMQAFARGLSNFFTPVTLNREHGSMDGAYTPTLRYIYRALSNDGTPVAAIVINADYERLLKSARLRHRPGHSLTLLNDAGDYLEVSGDYGSEKLQFHKDPNWQPSEFAEIVGSTLQAVNTNNEQVAFATGTALDAGLTISDQPSAGRIHVVSSVPQNVLMATTRETLYEMTWILAALAILTLIVSALFGYRLTRPLKQLTGAIETQGNSFSSIQFDTNSEDEVGRLAQAFSKLTDKLVAQTTEAVAVFDNAADGIVTIDRSGKIISVNPALESIFERCRDELVGQSISILLPQEKRAWHAHQIERIDDGFEAGIMGEDREVVGLRKSGDIFPLEVSISRSNTGGNEVFIGLVRDISDRREAERRLQVAFVEIQDAKAELERSNDELERFAYATSHDLKTPLRSISTGITLLREDLGDVLEGETRDLMNFVETGAERMTRMLDDVLEYCRVDYEAEISEFVNCADLMNEISFLASVPKSFKIKTGPTLATTWLPLMPLRTVLLNLVSNAVKYHDRQSGTIEISVADTGSMLEFSVLDDGPGIDPRYHAKIFQMFQKLESRDDVDGSGLGLAMVQKLVAQQGGKIFVESTGGRGTCFRFTWRKPEIEVQEYKIEA